MRLARTTSGAVLFWPDPPSHGFRPLAPARVARPGLLVAATVSALSASTMAGCATGPAAPRREPGVVTVPASAAAKAPDEAAAPSGLHRPSPKPPGASLRRERRRGTVDIDMGDGIPDAVDVLPAP